MRILLLIVVAIVVLETDVAYMNNIRFMSRGKGHLHHGIVVAELIVLNVLCIFNCQSIRFLTYHFVPIETYKHFQLLSLPINTSNYFHLYAQRQILFEQLLPNKTLPPIGLLCINLRLLPILYLHNTHLMNIMLIPNQTISLLVSSTCKK